MSPLTHVQRTVHTQVLDDILAGRIPVPEGFAEAAHDATLLPVALWQHLPLSPYAEAVVRAWWACVLAGDAPWPAAFGAVLDAGSQSSGARKLLRKSAMDQDPVSQDDPNVRRSRTQATRLHGESKDELDVALGGYSIRAVGKEIGVSEGTIRAWRTAKTAIPRAKRDAIDVIIERVSKGERKLPPGYWTKVRD